MRNEGHFLILHELVEEEKVYKDRVNINRTDSDKKELRRRYFLSENKSGISQPQYTFLLLLRCFLSFLAFQLKLLSSGAFLVSRNYLVTFTNSLEAVFKSCSQTRFWSLCGNCAKIEYHLFYNNGYGRICKEQCQFLKKTVSIFFIIIQVLFVLLRLIQRRIH